MFFSFGGGRQAVVVVVLLGSACHWIYRASVTCQRELLCRRPSCEPLRRAVGCIPSVLNTASCVLAARGGFWIWIWRCNSFGSSYIKMVNSTNVRHAATAYRRGTHPTNTTNDKRWGGKLKQYEGADRERRLDDKDNKFAIVQ